MDEITRTTVARVGVDLRAGRVLLAKPMAVDRFFAWCTGLPAGCVVAMEACRKSALR